MAISMPLNTPFSSIHLQEEVFDWLHSKKISFYYNRKIRKSFKLFTFQLNEISLSRYFSPIEIRLKDFISIDSFRRIIFSLLQYHREEIRK